MNTYNALSIETLKDIARLKVRQFHHRAENVSYLAHSFPKAEFTDSVMPLIHEREHSHLYLTHEEIIFTDKEKPYRLTPIIVTFYEGILTHIDIQNMIEMDIHIVRFKMTHVTRTDKLKLIQLLNKALAWVCEKYDVSQWPVAICMDIPNCCIRSGYLIEDIKETAMHLEMGSTLEMTSDVHYWNKCTPSRIFMDDPHTMSTITVGNEISLSGGPTVMDCIEVIDHQTIRCKVTRSGPVMNCEFVCIRGLRLKRPPLQKKDMELLEFAKEFRFDIVTVNSVRMPTTVKRVRKIFGDSYKPIVMSSIAEQEGVNHFDEILKVSDGIILAREFLAYNLKDIHQLTALQLMISGKCKQAGKPFFVSGNVMEHTLVEGELASCDLSDITNAVMQGAGFIIKNYSTPANAILAMDFINTVCKSVESAALEDEYYRLCDEYRMPINAAEACVLGCALMVRQTGSVVVVVPTVTGRTAMQLSHVSPQAIIVTISTNPDVARRLQVYKGIVAIIYDKKHKNDWYEEMEARIQFAVTYGVKKHILKYGNTYVTLCKSAPTSAYCDSASVWTVMTKETGKLVLDCDEDGTAKPPRRLSGPSTHLLGVHHHHHHHHHAHADGDHHTTKEHHHHHHHHRHHKDKEATTSKDNAQVTVEENIDADIHSPQY